LKDIIGIFKDLLIGKSNNLFPKCLKISRPLFIILNLLVMNLAINFDYQSAFCAIKINNVCENYALPEKAMPA